MALDPIVCTADVTHNSDVVTVHGVVLTPGNCFAPIPVALAGLSYSVKARLSTTTFQLSRPWTGATAAGIECELAQWSQEMLSRVELSKTTRDYSARLALLDSRGHGLFYQVLGYTGAADPGPGRISRNAAAWADVTEIDINVIDASPTGVDQSIIIDQWLEGTQLDLQTTAGAAHVLLEMTQPATTPAPGWRRLTVIYVGAAGIVADSDDVRVVDRTDGRDLKIDGAGLYAGRAAHDAELKGYVYLSTNGDGGAIANAVLYLKLSNGTADWSAAIPFQGPRGYVGWAPLLAGEDDGARRVLKLSGYVGGEGAAPTANVGKYLKADGTYTAIKADAMDIRGPTGATGLDGASQFTRVRLVATGNVDINTGLVNGSTIDGVVLATGDVVLLAGQTAAASNGPYVAVAAGPASRHPSFATYDSMPGCGFSVMEGTASADTIWTCTSDKGGTLGVTALALTKVTGHLTTRGDLLVRGISSLQRLAVGTARFVLTSDGADPGWKVPEDLFSGVTTETVDIVVGKGRAGSGSSMVDLVGDTTYNGFGTRLLRNAGANGNSELRHRGTGELRLDVADNGILKAFVNGGLMFQQGTGAFQHSWGYATKAGVGAGSWGGNVFNFMWSGSNFNVWIDGSNIGSVAFTSDARLKHQVSRLPDGALAQILALSPVTYRWRDEGIFKDDGITHVGFLAHEVQSVIPSAVNGAPDSLDGEGNVQPQSINDRDIIATLVRAVQELEARVKELEGH